MSRRTMTFKARNKVKALLAQATAPSSHWLGDHDTEIDPSNMHQFGFSRMPRRWQQHPLTRCTP